MRPRAVEIAPPFGGQWAALNGPSNASGHRRLVIALNGADAVRLGMPMENQLVDLGPVSR